MRLTRVPMKTDSVAATPNDRPGINDLPDEVLLAVLSYLPVTQLFTTVPRVCQRWYQLHVDVSLLEQLKFTGDYPSNDAVIKILGRATRLKRLELTSRTDPHLIIERLNHPHLSTLVVCDTRSAPSSSIPLSTELNLAVSRCPLLHTLSLSGTHYLGHLLYRSLSAPCLRRLNVGWASCTDRLVTFVVGCHDITEFSAEFCSRLTDARLARVFETFAQTLTVVKINCQMCTDETLKALTKCRQLVTLNISKAEGITDEGILQLDRLLMLEGLEVERANSITEQGWIALFRTDMARRLRRLWLHYCLKVTDDVIACIVANLRDLVALQVEGDGFSKERIRYLQRHIPAQCSYRFRNMFETKRVAYYM